MSNRLYARLALSSGSHCSALCYGLWRCAHTPNLKQLLYPVFVRRGKHMTAVHHAGPTKTIRICITTSPPKLIKDDISQSPLKPLGSEKDSCLAHGGQTPPLNSSADVADDANAYELPMQITIQSTLSEHATDAAQALTGKPVKPDVELHDLSQIVYVPESELQKGFTISAGSIRPAAPKFKEMPRKHVKVAAAEQNVCEQCQASHQQLATKHKTETKQQNQKQEVTTSHPKALHVDQTRQTKQAASERPLNRTSGSTLTGDHVGSKNTLQCLPKKTASLKSLRNHIAAVPSRTNAGRSIRRTSSADRGIFIAEDVKRLRDEPKPEVVEPSTSKAVMLMAILPPKSNRREDCKALVTISSASNLKPIVTGGPTKVSQRALSASGALDSLMYSNPPKSIEIKGGNICIPKVKNEPPELSNIRIQGGIKNRSSCRIPEPGFEDGCIACDGCSSQTKKTHHEDLDESLDSCDIQIFGGTECMGPRKLESMRSKQKDKSQIQEDFFKSQLISMSETLF